ncbi:hypothetical protein K3495_g7617 [Podosphaera aphanis]|nr:hypothetical protein K3495_g7617 [Podosphaera aphanis]
MSASEHLIDFEVIENQKENIQSLPGGHSARALASIFSPSPLHQLPSPSDTSNINNIRRQEFESELTTIAESDDPLDIYDRYVRWTLDAYPSAQATPSSQLLPLLERATKAFINAAQYKNDPRYLKLWISYIQLVSDAPREAFAFIARHNIGQGLALFYEEFAAWLEKAGRWKQAEEIYKMGIEREATPIARLLRKFDEFQSRAALQPVNNDQPSSPVLPTIRPALATKVDLFAPAISRDPQEPISNPGNQGAPRSGRQKLQIFSDKDDRKPAVPSNKETSGWQSIGSLAERKKENTMDSKPWVGETLKAGGKISSAKIPVFKDESSSQFTYLQVTDPIQHQVTVNQRGKTERIFVNLEALYPTPNIFGSELSIEELRAGHKGWLSKVWKPETFNQRNQKEDIFSLKRTDKFLKINKDPIKSDPRKPLFENTSCLDENLVLKEPVIGGQTRKMKIREINETQIIRAKLSSPTGPRLTKRKSKEQTMTLHTKAAIDDIYDLFNQPLKPPEDVDKEEDNTDDDLSDSDYTSAGESTTTGKLIYSSAAEDNKNEKLSSRHTNEENFPEIENQDQITQLAHDVCDNLNVNTNKTESQKLSEKQIFVKSTSPEPSSLSETKFTPIHNCESPSQPYRDPVQVSQSRLPFMTPIAEKTESSLGIATICQDKSYFKAKSSNGESSPKCSFTAESPFQGINFSKKKKKENSQLLPHIFDDGNSPSSTAQKVATSSRQSDIDIVPKKPVINDAQCNPTDAALREVILYGLDPPLQSYEGYFDYADLHGGKTADIKKFVRLTTKAHRKGSEKTTTNSSTPPSLQFPGSCIKYLLRRELGAGTFAPVYLIENVSADDSENDEKKNKSPQRIKTCKDLYKRFHALKMEHNPSAWEFYILRQARYRLSGTRALDSVIDVQEMHMFKDECFLIEDFHSQGNLLDIINIAKEDKSGSGVMDETLAMFFTIELFRTVEKLHEKGILHGDLKADNCLVRFDPLSEAESWSNNYQRNGSLGWHRKGICLIDFGRGIDMKVFDSNVQFIADWESGPQDCAEIREMRPWTYQIDYHGLSGILHSMLFGKYIDTIADTRCGVGPGARKIWRLRESLKRYWQIDLWAEAFDLLLNPISHIEGEEASRLPLSRSMKACREKMELWLEGNSERGVGLQSLIRKVETYLARKK